MSLNLTVPKEPALVKERSAVAAAAASRTRRAKSPILRPHLRAKSKSPNPSLCSVLSRVKDWELGAFTPKTALADNVDVMNRNKEVFSDSEDGLSNKDDSGGSERWKPGEESPSPPRPVQHGDPSVQPVASLASIRQNAASGEGLLKAALCANLGMPAQLYRLPY
jgi:hypothetical protein